eukprot:Filipodium_phascolosomae@DN6102_c0_g1_i1.p1
MPLPPFAIFLQPVSQWYEGEFTRALFAGGFKFEVMAVPNHFGSKIAHSLEGTPLFSVTSLSADHRSGQPATIAAISSGKNSSTKGAPRSAAKRWFRSSRSNVESKSGGMSVLKP